MLVNYGLFTCLSVILFEQNMSVSGRWTLLVCFVVYARFYVGLSGLRFICYYRI